MKHPNTALRSVLATAADITRTADRAGIQIARMSARRYAGGQLDIHLADGRCASDLTEALDVEVEKGQHFPRCSAQTVTVDQVHVFIFGAPVKQVTA